MLVATAVVIGSTAGCASGPTQGESAVTRRSASETVAVVNGLTIDRSELFEPLAEAAGRAVLDEALLDRLLDREATRNGIEITPAMLQAESERLARALRRESGLDATSGAEVVERLRRDRGLGPDRFGRLLRRNAILRALVAGSVEVREDEIRLAHSIRHGERHIVRVHTRATEREAAADRDEILALGGSSEAFAALAVDRSDDASAARGGLLDPLSLADPAFPQTVRSLIGGLAEGEVSSVMALDDGFAVVRLERMLPPTGVPLEASRAEIESTLRVRKERIAADDLARDLLRSADITVLSAPLRWSRGL